MTTTTARRRSAQRTSGSVRSGGHTYREPTAPDSTWALTLLTASMMR